ncbi:DivIVA domain-containing protein [Pseudonocardia sp.]|jgi:DivIVA domain-containing protein|uniref:DivIVA domain-containing protein n=1 Tax=Pseudonocardia sp. TaxID=60912 RepID=UPI0031FBC9D4
MTPDAFAPRPRKSPEEIRNHVFGTRLRGLDADEVAAFLADLADQVESSDDERESLREELDRLRSRTPDADQRAEITAYAVGLLSQAQQIADDLVAEAELYARDLVAASRDQHRAILERAQQSVETAVRQFPAADADGAAGGQVSSAELEYVRTFTQVAHVQLRSVLDALAEQVERLGHFPEVSAQATPPAVAPQEPAAATSAQDDVEWWKDLSSTPPPPAMPG